MQLIRPKMVQKRHKLGSFPAHENTRGNSTAHFPACRTIDFDKNRTESALDAEFAQIFGQFAESGDGSRGLSVEVRSR